MALNLEISKIHINQLINQKQHQCVSLQNSTVAVLKYKVGHRLCTLDTDNSCAPLLHAAEIINTTFCIDGYNESQTHNSPVMYMIKILFLGDYTSDLSLVPLLSFFSFSFSFKRSILYRLSQVHSCALKFRSDMFSIPHRS